MKIFIDSANLEEIKTALSRGFISGITTNPSLLAKEPKGKFEKHVGAIIDLIKSVNPNGGIHLSVEVFSRDPREIIAQAKRFVKEFQYPGLSIKIQMGLEELGTIHELSREGVSVNCTACMTPLQAVMAAAAGAKYVSLFWGRIRDAGDSDKLKGSPGIEQAIQAMRDARTLEDLDFDPGNVVRETRHLLEQSGLKSEIIAGSMRSVLDIKQAGLSGAHIVTVPPKFFDPMATHPKTEEVVAQFLADFQEWMT